MSNFQDLESAVSTLSSTIGYVKNTTLDDVESMLNDLESEIGEVESELGYVESDLDELEGYQALGGVDDFQEYIDLNLDPSELQELIDKDGDVAVLALEADVVNLKGCITRAEDKITRLKEALAEVGTIVDDELSGQY